MPTGTATVKRSSGITGMTGMTVSMTKGDGGGGPPASYALSDNEKFTDFSGDIVDIDVRGERAWDKLFFHKSELEEFVDIEFNEDELERGIHVHSFDIKQSVATGTSRRKQTIIESVDYITYAGLMKMMFAAKSPVGLRFQRWAAKRLFAAHFGGREDKMDAAAELLGIPSAMLRAFVDAHFCSSQVNRMHELEAQIANLSRTNDQLRMALEMHETHDKKTETLIERVLEEKNALIAEKEKRIEELNSALRMYRDVYYSKDISISATPTCNNSLYDM